MRFILRYELIIILISSALLAPYASGLDQFETITNDLTNNRRAKFNTNEIQNIPPAIITTTATATSLSTTSNTLDVTSRNAKICPGIHIRNDLKSFEQLKGCNIIDGPLTIALVSRKSHPYEPKDYDNITFPDLREVTDYLLFFRVEGLSTLSRLFPNLAVIRGNELVENYALIIYEMMHLQRINLPNLTDILRGSVRFESNPNLCFVETIYWEAICKRSFSPHFIKDNKLNCKDQCPQNCSNSGIRLDLNRFSIGTKEQEHDRSSFCWTNQDCQELCAADDGMMALPPAPGGGCCHRHCGGGCYERGRSDRCYSCRYFIQGDHCREVCDSRLFEYKGRCLTELECTSIIEPVLSDQCNLSFENSSTSNLKPIRVSNNGPGKCQSECPPGYEEDPLNKNRCVACDRGKCRKVCTPPQGNDKPFMVTNVNSLRELSGCNVINGSLEISMKGGKNVLNELETAFQELDEIKGFLKITRSYPILTLGFLSKLKAINGSFKDRGQYSLIIIDNPNLQELFISKESTSDHKQMTILEGKIFVHLNPKLCPHRIDNLKTYANVADWDERDVSLHTNGDKEACNTEKLEAQFLYGTARMAMIRFQNFALTMNDPRSLLYYLINYREVSDGNVTMFDGRDGCNSNKDVWLTKEVSPIEMKPHSNKTDKYQDTAINVKPSTRYALYVKTFTIIAGSTGALSDIIYFSTAPDTPGIPRHIGGRADSHDVVRVFWYPPSKPNGIIATYTLTITKIPEMDDFQNMNICGSRADKDRVTAARTINEPDISIFEPSRPRNTTVTNDTPVVGQYSCSKTTSDADADVQAEVVSFQDMIIDIVYLKQTCPHSNPSKTSRRRRRASDGYEFKSTINTEPLATQMSLEQNLDHLRMVAANVSSSDDPSPAHTIRFNRTVGKKEVVLPAGAHEVDGRMEYRIEDLEHYSLYTIEVVACHDDFKGIRTKTSSDYSRCSLQAITQVRTRPIKENDQILASTVEFHPANESTSLHIITWNKPEQPNGIIFAYRIRYRPKNGNSDLWTEGCLNSPTHNRLNLSDINPGSYLLSVRAVTSIGEGAWSEPDIEFEIPQNYILSPAVLALLIIFGLVLLAFVVAFSAYYYQKKRHELTNGLVYASVNPDYIQYDPDEWEVDKSNVIIGDHIGTGAFGMVYKGQLISEKGTFKCAVKTMPPTSTAKQRMDFLREASIMKQFDTFHVVKLMGVVSTTNPVYVIMEFMENGDLKSYLRSVREVHQQEKKTLVDGIYLMAAQIADGMAYLASKKFVHRDLAARNCMVGEDQIVKIGDFGLTRDIYVNDYYRRDTHGRLPVRWMAPESLLDNLYTSASDVWSFGIVVWEIVTFSAYPYQGQSNDEVIKRVSAGFTMSRPENCPDKLYNIMQRCWRKEMNERPTFTEIVEDLLPETKDKLYPNCFCAKNKMDSESNTQPNSGDNNSGAESYPLLSWTSNRINGLTNGVNHVQSDTV